MEVLQQRITTKFEVCESHPYNGYNGWSYSMSSRQNYAWLAMGNFLDRHWTFTTVSWDICHGLTRLSMTRITGLWLWSTALFKAGDWRVGRCTVNVKVNIYLIRSDKQGNVNFHLHLVMTFISEMKYITFKKIILASADENCLFSLPVYLQL